MPRSGSNPDNWEALSREGRIVEQNQGFVDACVATPPLFLTRGAATAGRPALLLSPSPALLQGEGKAEGEGSFFLAPGDVRTSLWQHWVFERMHEAPNMKNASAEPPLAQRSGREAVSGC
jgi:hypothetical protein